MEKLTITESTLRQMVFEEFDAMVESGEIDEGVLDTISRGWTQAKGALAGAKAKAGTTAQKWKKQAGAGLASALGADQTAAELGGQAADLEAQSKHKQLVAKAQTALKPLGAAYENFAKNAQAMGILELPAMQQAAQGLQQAIAAINQAITAAPQQQQAQGGEGEGEPEMNMEEYKEWESQLKTAWEAAGSPKTAQGGPDYHADPEVSQIANNQPAGAPPRGLRE